MKFFKHFTDAHEGRSMLALMNKFGLEGYAAYFILAEICGKKLEKEADETYTEDHLKFTFNERIVREKLRMRSTKVELFLNYCATLDLLQFTKVEDEITFYFPKLLESMDRDSKRARTERADGAPKNKIKNKIKNKEEDKDKEKDIKSSEAEKSASAAPAILPKKKDLIQIQISGTNSVLVSADLIASWADTYPKEFLDLEIRKARSWILANPQKAPKTAYGRFFDSWLSRGWETYRKSLKGNPSAITVADLDELLGAS